MSQLSIVATIIVKDQYKNELEKVFRYLVDHTRKEDGNVSYDLHQDVQNPLKYIILEVWKSQNDISKHNETLHFKEFLSTIEGKVESVDINVIEKIY